MWKLVPLALGLSAAACDLSGIGAAVGCPLGNALGDSLAPADRVGEIGVVEARISCPFRFPFSMCSDNPLAVGAVEDVVLELRTGVPFSVESSDPSVMTLTGFESIDHGCGDVASGRLLLASPGDVSLVVRGTQGEVLDRIPFRVQRPARLVPASDVEPIQIGVGQEVMIGAFPENKVGDPLHASGGFAWSVDVAGVVELASDPGAVRTVRGVAPGTAQVAIILDGVSTSISVTVVP